MVDKEKAAGAMTRLRTKVIEAIDSIVLGEHVDEAELTRAFEDAMSHLNRYQASVQNPDGRPISASGEISNAK